MNKVILIAVLSATLPSIAQPSDARDDLLLVLAQTAVWEDATDAVEAPPAELGSPVSAAAPAPVATAAADAPVPVPEPVPVPAPVANPAPGPVLVPVPVPAAAPTPVAPPIAPATPLPSAARPAVAATPKAPQPVALPRATLLTDAQLCGRPLPSSTDNEWLPAGTVVHVVSKTINITGAWWYVVPPGHIGGWLQESELGPITR
jgi:hypothetical protein